MGHAGEGRRGHRGHPDGPDHRIRGRPLSSYGRLPSPRHAHSRAQYRLGLPSPAAHLVQRRATHDTAPAGPPTTSVGHRVGPRPAGSPTAARRYLGQVELSLRPNTVNAIEHDLREFGPARRRPPGRDQLRRPAARHIEAYKTWSGQHRPTPADAAEPRQRQEPADQPALLLRPHHRLGLPGRADPPAALRRRPAPDRQTSAPLSRRRRRHETHARRSRRPRPAVPAHRGVVGPHRNPQERAARPDRRRRRPDRLRLLAADPDRQTPQRPLHPAAPATERAAGRLDHRPPPARLRSDRSSSTKPTRHAAASRDRAVPGRPTTPASVTSPHTNCATPWPPRPSTEA